MSCPKSLTLKVLIMLMPMASVQPICKPFLHQIMLPAMLSDIPHSFLGVPSMHPSLKEAYVICTVHDCFVSWILCLPPSTCMHAWLASAVYACTRSNALALRCALRHQRVPVMFGV